MAVSKHILLKKILENYNQKISDPQFTDEEQIMLGMLHMGGYVEKSAFLRRANQRYHQTLAQPLTAAGVAELAQNAWRRFKKNKIVEILIDWAAIIAFVTSVTLAVVKIIEAQKNLP